MKYSFRNDYSEGAHPKILEAMLKTNSVQQEGYGEDAYCLEAICALRNKLENPNAHIHFVSGGTQANLIVISSILRPYESVISASTGHINVHETGAIEATGHKVNAIETTDGKLTPEGIKEVLDFHIDEHMVKPRLVYISNTSEVGTIYKKYELEELASFCKTNDLLLFLDGARLGSALCSEDNDLTLAQLSSLVDVFYIGGTKNGALLGEAIIINEDKLNEDFRFHLKQRGALLAKGRLLGLQFLELFKDNLFFDLARHANARAMELSRGIKAMGYELLVDAASNQVFPILPNRVIDRLAQNYGFHVWKRVDADRSCVRLVTSWATEKIAVVEFLETLKGI